MTFLPLEDIVVLDLTKLLPGPFCTMILADLGATVIKVEHPNPLKDLARFTPPFITGKKTNSKIGSLFYFINRNKKSITLNYTVPEGRELFLKLVKKADVVVESFRPGTLKVFGLGPEVLKSVNPRLILASITGFGQFGPRARDPGHDMNYISLAGFTFLAGKKNEGPMPFPVPFGDYIGALFSVIGIVAAIVEKIKSRKAEEPNKNEFIHVDSAIFDSIMALWPSLLWPIIMDKTPFKKSEEVLSGFYPFYRMYKCKDGKYLCLGAIEQKFWDNFCDAINHPDLKTEQFSGINYVTSTLGLKSCRNFDEINKVIEEIFMQKTRDEWIKYLSERNVCCSPVYEPSEVWIDNNVKERKILGKTLDPDLGEIQLLRFPVLFNENSMPLHPAPKFGEHNEEIFKEFLDINSEKLRILKKKKIV